MDYQREATYLWTVAILLDNLDAAISGIPAAVEALQAGIHGGGSWEDGSASDVSFIKDMLGGRWLIDETTNQLVCYKADNSTEVARFDLFDKDGNPTFVNIMERVRV